MLSFATLAMMAVLSTEADANAALSARTLTQPVVTQDLQANESIRLEDIEVTGRPLTTLIDTFVAEVAAPAGRRNLARWDEPICVAVVNLQDAPAQYIADRVYAVGADLGLCRGGRDCQPNVVIVASDEPDTLAQTMTARVPRSFRPGGSGMDRGNGALEAFKQSDDAVRWWTVSMPVDSMTGQRASRIPGECSGNCSVAGQFAPNIFMLASRVTTQIVDEIVKTVVILDIDKVAEVSSQQLVDYISMVVFAQIDPRADTSTYSSILNVFDTPYDATGLTQWDRAYLEGLYQAQRAQRGPAAARDEIANSIRRAHTRLSSVEE
ncbi:hypothetical protein ACETK8_12575 [Brevundimonas staleyi]|uniref:DUF2927 domain-containing protein n=1 Tax=Brevundimonas staleyi TaxID=74326 RepID=A0ABW0FMS3_9CAUL